MRGRVYDESYLCSMPQRREAFVRNMMRVKEHEIGGSKEFMGSVKRPEGLPRVD